VGLAHDQLLGVQRREEAGVGAQHGNAKPRCAARPRRRGAGGRPCIEAAAAGGEPEPLTSLHCAGVVDRGEDSGSPGRTRRLTEPPACVSSASVRISVGRFQRRRHACGPSTPEVATAGRWPLRCNLGNAGASAGVAVQPLAAGTKPVSTGRLGPARSDRRPGTRAKRRNARLWRIGGLCAQRGVETRFRSRACPRTMKSWLPRSPKLASTCRAAHSPESLGGS
jgi:hypothetical protein